METEKARRRSSKQQKKQIVSYYDTKNKREFVEDKKNLLKIRSKNLRDFCEFCLFMESTPLIALQGNKKTTDTLLLLHKFKGAEAFFITKKETDNPKIKEMMENTNIKVNWISRRTIYDYMNAYKFIKATRNYGNDIFLDMFMKTGGQKI